MESVIDVGTVLSVLSCGFTVYFWFVKANREKPLLNFYQLSHFVASCRSNRENPEMKRLCMQQQSQGGVLIMNQSTRQNSVVLFDCYLLTDEGEIQGDWGYTGDDSPPWNIGPESTLAFSPACFFDVPQDYEVPENPKFRIEVITASGKTFSHELAKFSPRLSASSHPLKKAA